MLELRFGLNGESPRTLVVVGRAFNVTRERVRQIESLALKKLGLLAEAQMLRDVAWCRGRALTPRRRSGLDSAAMGSGWFEELAGFLRIPSVSADPAHAGDVRAAGAWVCDFVSVAGGSAELVDCAHGRSAARDRRVHCASVAGMRLRPCFCYGHFDVQPPAPLELWASPPLLEPGDPRRATSYGRGTVDDKGQL